jgi:hypothetical protein
LENGTLAGGGGPRGSSDGSPTPPRRRRLATALWLLALVAGGAAALKFAHGAGEELPFFRVDARQAQVLAMPDWMPPEWIAEARAVMAARPAFSIFDDAAVNDLRRRLEGLTWVRRVDEKERALPRTVRLIVKPREPVAVVEADGAFVLTDEQGVVLPPATFRADQIEALPRVTRWRGSFAAPVVGKPWADESVFDGVAVALLLPDLTRRVPGVRIVKIDVTNSGGAVDARECEVLLVTSNNVKIKWGRAPRTGTFGELPVDQKLANLARVESHFAGLAGLSVVNLRFDEPDVFDIMGQWVQRPTAMAPPAPRTQQ